MKKKFLALFALVAIIATLISGCEMETAGTDDSVVQCVGKADDPACEPDTTESPPGDDITSESLDSESTSSEDSGPSVECIPAYPYPDGTWIECEGALYPCQILWDLSNCTLSCWKKLGEPPPGFKAAPQDTVFAPREDGTPWCTPFPGQ